MRVYLVFSLPRFLIEVNVPAHWRRDGGGRGGGGMERQKPRSFFVLRAMRSWPGAFGLVGVPGFIHDNKRL